MKRVWITGARGFIGRHLCAQLSHAGKSVYGIGFGHWSDVEAKNWGIKRWLNGAIEPSNLYKLIEDGPPQHIYHLAGGSSVGLSLNAPHEDFMRTVNSTAQLYDWLRKESPKTTVTVVSSAAVYGAGHNDQLSVGSLLKPYSPYGHHKLMVEQLTHSYAQCFGLQAIIIRLFSVYGPQLYKQLLWDICSYLAKGTSKLSLNGDGGELRDWTHVADVSNILRETSHLATAEVPILNAGTGIATTVREIVTKVVYFWGADTDIQFSGEKRLGDPYSLISEPLVIDRTLFEWKINLDIGIKTYVAWFKSRHE